MRKLGLLAVLTAVMGLSVASASQAGVAKVLRVDNNLDADLTVFLDGKQLGVVKTGTVGQFLLPAAADATKVAHLLGTEDDGGVYKLDVTEAHPNGFTWGVFEGDGQG